MGSGLHGQRFAVHGYLPVDAHERARHVALLEAESERAGVTQMFIEAPYRNEALFASIVDTCRGDTLLCLAADLTLATEFVCTQPIAEWQRERPRLNRRPTVFLLHRERMKPARAR
jgi:16S rRNA (cytidine1402-2'-O)-methyltransferase